MSVYGATHARFDGDKLTHLRVGRVDTMNRTFDGAMRDLEVIDVVDLISTGGDVVYLIQQVDGHYPPGARLRVKTESDGSETLVEDGGPEAGRSIADLPRF